MNICADCKHHRGNDGYMKCDHPNNFETSIVTGWKSRVIDYCYIHRLEYATERLCGKSGKWFEAGKPARGWFK